MSILTSILTNKSKAGDVGKQGAVDRRMVATPWVARTAAGLWVGADGSVWLYRKLPAYPFAWELADVQLSKGDRIYQMLEELGKTSKPPSVGEFASLSKNRRVHLVTHVRYIPPPIPPGSSPEQAAFLFEVLGETGVVVPDQVTAIGVELWPAVSSSKKRRNRGVVSQMKDYVAQYTGGKLPDLELYETDKESLSQLLGRYGAEVLTKEERLFLERWMSGPGNTDEPTFVEEDDRLVVRDRNPAAFDRWVHLYELSTRCDEAGDHARAEELIAEAEKKIIEGGNVIQFLAVTEAGMPDEIGKAPMAPWLMDAQQHEQAAICTSLRFELEPGRVTRNRARRLQRHQFRQIEEELQANSVLSRVEQEEAFSGAKAVEDHYATTTEPSITKMSVLWAWQYDDSATENFADFLRARYDIDANVMQKRQFDCYAETLPTSPIMAAPDRPYSHDAFIQTIAYSGMGATTHLGDSIAPSRDPHAPLPVGAMSGIAHPSGTVVWTNPWASSELNTSPTMTIVGQPGSGKLLTLDTPIPTPSGWTTMGELRVGDKVIGADGSPCNVVHLSDIDETPELYDVHLSDGQVITACKDHQWLVSSFLDRNRGRSVKRVAAIERWERVQLVADELRALAKKYNDSDMLTFNQIFEVVSTLDTTWGVKSGLRRALTDAGCHPELRVTNVVVEVPTDKRQRVKSDPVILYPALTALRGLVEVWGSIMPAKDGTRAKKLHAKIAAARAVAAGCRADEELTLPEIGRRLRANGAPLARSFQTWMKDYLVRAGVDGHPGRATVVVPFPESFVSSLPCQVWSAPVAFKGLANLLLTRAGERPRTEYDSQVLTTEQMVAKGVVRPAGQSEFAIAVPGALQTPDAELPVDPYILGAWLGDGGRGGGSFTQGATEACTDGDGLTDQDHLLTQLAASGIEAGPIPSSQKTIGTKCLAKLLKAAGVLNEKHIPMTYLRASEPQRLALLQGLMDTDGTVSAKGACDLTLCDERLATDALELVRSLGIKASMTSSPAALTEDDPDNPGGRRRRVTSTRYRIHFTTTKRVFRLPRKACRLPETVRETQKWLYITAITPTESRPGRCIMVDSPDHTYLVAGFVPTHNTFYAQLLCYQFQLQGIPVFFVNPKGSDSLRDYAEFCGGQLIRISDATQKPGAFDPFRFADPETIVQIAQEHITTSLNERGNGLTMEQNIAVGEAISKGVRMAQEMVARNGGSIADYGSVGQSLHFLPPHHAQIAKNIWAFARQNPNFALGIAIEPRGEMTAETNFTLVEFDQEAALPERTNPNELTMVENSAIAAQRILWRAGIEIMRKAGGGVVAGDEAWTFLSSPQASRIIDSLNRKGRSMQIFLMLMTQRIADVVAADLEAYLSRVGVFHLEDKREIEAALQLCRMELRPDLVELIRNAKPEPADPGDPERGIPGRPARPSQMIFKDIEGRHGVVTVEPVLERYRLAFSTNRRDKERRQRLRDSQ